MIAPPRLREGRARRRQGRPRGGPRGSARGRAGREAHARRFALRLVLYVEELAFRESDRAREKDAGNRLDGVVERQHGVVVDLTRDGNPVLGLRDLTLEL